MGIHKDGASRSGLAALAVALLAGGGSVLTGCWGEVFVEPSAAYDVQRYALVGAYDWQHERLTATVEITLTTLEPGIDTLIIDSAVSAVHSVQRAEGGPLPFHVEAKEKRLLVDISSFPERSEGATLRLVIAYEAAPSEWLKAVGERAGDPVPGRVLYTRSEPEEAPSWLPCHNRPDDRAVFSVEMAMDAGEKMVANGDLVLDNLEAPAGRRMRYETQYPLPTYLMAFAIGDFEVTAANHGELPISVWHRPGVPGDFQGTLGELQRQLDVFEPLLGPFPFEKYALVLLPEFAGGMEHASATFQGETSSAQPNLLGDVTLTAHELGHQWFGDLVTVATWDDLWIKEGMARLLGAEVSRVFEDKSGAGTLFGDSWRVVGGEAIRDTTLAPERKYTSGPYDRAAWLLTQIRSLVGEEVFWARLRGVLEEHRMGAIGSMDFLAEFEPFLSDDQNARARRALDARALPGLELKGTAGIDLTVTLRDPEAILVAPIEVEWHRESGEIERQTLVHGQPLALKREAVGDFLVLDPADVHPEGRLIAVDAASGAAKPAWAPLRAPAPAAIPRFLEIAGTHQLAAMAPPALFQLDPANFEAFLSAMHGEGAAAAALELGCRAALNEPDPMLQIAWSSLLSPLLAGEPHYLGLALAGRYSSCSAGPWTVGLFAAEWAQLAEGLATTSLPADRAYYLSRFDLPNSHAFSVWGPPTGKASSLRARVLASAQLQTYASLLETDAELASWRAMVLELLRDSEASEVLRQLVSAAATIGLDSPADNADFLVEFTRILRSRTTLGAHAAALCAAHLMTSGQGGAWESFLAGLGDVTLSRSAKVIAGDPESCYR